MPVVKAVFMASMKIRYLPISIFAATFETCFFNPRIYLHMVVLSFSIGFLKQIPKSFAYNNIGLIKLSKV